MNCVDLNGHTSLLGPAARSCLQTLSEESLDFNHLVSGGISHKVYGLKRQVCCVWVMCSCDPTVASAAAVSPLPPTHPPNHQYL